MVDELDDSDSGINRDPRFGQATKLNGNAVEFENRGLNHSWFQENRGIALSATLYKSGRPVRYSIVYQNRSSRDIAMHDAIPIIVQIVIHCHGWQTDPFFFRSTGFED